MKSLILTAFLPSLISSHDFCDLDTYLHTDNHQVEKFKVLKTYVTTFQVSRSIRKPLQQTTKTYSR